ncbi:MAG: Ig-like domain-containing protein, partial [Burkholderiaceae bacterium]|nr:Ig-like domain-containing protein [Burkholderiaceae bacterium]
MADTNSPDPLLISATQSDEVHTAFDAGNGLSIKIDILPAQTPYVYLSLFPFSPYSSPFFLAPSGSTAVTTVTTQPSALLSPSSYFDNAGAIQSARNTAPTTDDTTPGLNIGFVPSKQTPNLYVDGNKAASTYDAQAGTLTPASPLHEGPHVLTYTLSGYSVTYTQTAGKDGTATTQATAVGPESAQSGSLAITIDTTPPDAPTLTSTGNATKDTPPTFSGTGEVGAIITLHDGTTVLAGTATVQSDGHWRFIPAMPFGDGAHSITATATDPAGNTSAASSALNFAADTAPPPQVDTGSDPLPQSVDIAGYEDAVPPVTGFFHSGTTTDDTKPALGGNIYGGLNPGDVIKIFDGATYIGTVETIHGLGAIPPDWDGVTPLATQVWSFQLPETSAGTHTYTAQIFNAAGVGVAKS